MDSDEEKSTHCMYGTSMDVKNLCDSIIEKLKTKESSHKIDIKKKRTVSIKLPFPDEESLNSSDDVIIKEDTISVKNTYQLVFQDEYWEYIPKFLSGEYFGKLLPQLKKICESYREIYKSRCVSVLYAMKIPFNRSKSFDYANTPICEWKTAPLELLEMREIIEEYFDFKIDYVLCHIYRGLPEKGNPGSDCIGLHEDRESMNSPIISVSLGSTRRFIFREKNDQKNIYDQITLSSGDVLHMYGPKKLKNGKIQGSYQSMFTHEVPKMNINDLTNHIQSCGVEIPKGRKTYKFLEEIIRKNNISPDRINLTFHQFDISSI